MTSSIDRIREVEEIAKRAKISVGTANPRVSCRENPLKFVKFFVRTLKVHYYKKDKSPFVD